MPDFTPALRELLARQDGVVTRAQLLEHDVSYPAVRWNAGRAWRVILPQVFGVFREQPTVRQRQVAALLWAGPRSVLSGATAARLHGVTSAEPRERVHVLVPAPQVSRSSGFAEVRRTLIHDGAVVTKGPLRLSSPARAVVDAARLARGHDARAAILIEAVQRGITTIDDLQEWALRLRPRDAVPLRLPLADAASGAWSLPESELLDLVATSTVLPDPWANPELTGPTGERLTTPDAWFDDVAFAVMVHSRRHHSEGEQWDDTVEKDGDLVAVGVVVAGVTPHRLRRHPDAVLMRLERSYLAARGRPRPLVRAAPRHLLAGRADGPAA
ncbi:MAG TPA: hypothetical protein VES93_12935 [Ornithinibacter sp.]|nr:hypothetical protein [Ornithinibacter sp.]